MKRKFSSEIETGRVTGCVPWGSKFGAKYGKFVIMRGNVPLIIIASQASDRVPFEHVSVSTPSRCPTWEEMCWVKDQFFDPEECTMQLHPPRSRYKNVHPYCLHMWRPARTQIPMPPLEAV